MIKTTFISLASDNPDVEFVLVGTNTANQNFNHVTLAHNVHDLHVPCWDNGMTCKKAHGYAEVDDFFIVLLSIWHNIRGDTVAIISHDKYSWWENSYDIPRAMVSPSGTIQLVEYSPDIYSGISIYMDLQDISAKVKH
jgi:hypothetical protein